jgi:protein-S-isoprenylcysteine O-methyltransferase Ste14
MVTVVLPGIIIFRTKAVDIGWSLASPLSLAPVLGGIVLTGLGLTLMVKTITLFATIGKGTLAPWEPPTRLVVRGIYRHVRNPMIIGVFLVLAGESVFFGSFPVFTWFIIVLLGNLIYIPLLEEHGLESRFGEDYVLYKRNVPRWIPRVRPWDQSNSGGKLN